MWKLNSIFSDQKLRRLLKAILKIGADQSEFQFKNLQIRPFNNFKAFPKDQSSYFVFPRKPQKLVVSEYQDK
jgi:hypothetical protein